MENTSTQKITNNKCQCGNGESSIEHLLLFCQRYTEQRKEFMTNMNLIMMINDNNDNTILTIAQLLDNPKFSKITLKFIQSTTFVDIGRDGKQG